jgi:WD40 repeat protein
MLATNGKRLRAVLWVVGIFATGACLLTRPAASGQEAGGDKPKAAQKTDLFGDPLPQGALARMGTVRWRHPGTVTFVAYVDGGKHLLTASSDGLFRVWDVTSGRELRRFGSEQVVAVATTIGVGGFPSYYRSVAGNSFALAPDGKTLATAVPAGITLWDVAAGKEIRTISQGTPKANPRGRRLATASLAFSPDGKTLAAMDNSAGHGQSLVRFQIRLWNVADGTAIRSIGKPPDAKRPIRLALFLAGGGSSLFFLQGGKALVCAGMELDKGQPSDFVRVYDAQSGKELRQFQLKGRQNRFTTPRLAVAPDGKTLAVAGGGAVRLIDLESGKEIRQLGQAQRVVLVQTPVFSPDGKTLATYDGRSAIRLWDVDKGEELASLGQSSTDLAGPYRGPAAAIAFSPDGKTLAEGSANVVRLWNVAARKEVLPESGTPPSRSPDGHRQGVSGLAVSPDGKVLTTYATDQVIRRWDVSTGAQTHSFALPAPALGVALSADGTRVAAHAGNAVRLWDIEARKEVRTLQLPAPQVGVPRLLAGTGLALSHDGKLLAVRGFDQAIRLLDTTTGTELRVFSEQSKAAPNPGGGFAVPPFLFGGQARLVFSPDSARVASVAGSGGPQPGFVVNVPPPPMVEAGIRLWSLNRGKRPRAFEDQQRSILALTFSPDGRTIASANSDNTLSLWEALTGKECLHISVNRAKPDAPPNPLGAFGGITCLAISPDGRTLAGGGSDRLVHLWDLYTGKELGVFKGHAGAVLTVAFARDSRTLFSASDDTTALVWDGKRLIKDRQGPIEEPTGDQLQKLWDDLARDPVRAYAAVVALSRVPKQAVPLLQERIKPAQGVDAARLQQLIAGLESKDFQVRRKSTEELAKLGELAQSALQKALEKPATLEMTRRLEKLLDQVDNDRPPPPELLRALRSVDVLERQATTEARQVLQRLAQGAAGARLTRHAEAALKRLAR